MYQVPRTGLYIQHGCGHDARPERAFRTLVLRTFDRLDCAANAKINLKRNIDTHCILVEFML